MNHTDSVFHLVVASDWKRDFDGVRYVPPSIAREGFVHLSTAEQLPVSRSRYFENVDDLLVVEIDASRLDHLIWEDLVGHGAHPHHYGPIRAEAIRTVRPWDAADAR